MKKARHNAPSARVYKRGRKNNSVQRVQKNQAAGLTAPAESGWNCFQGRDMGGGCDWALGQITCKAPRAEGAAKFWEAGARRAQQSTAPFPDTPGLAAVGYEGWEDPFLLELEPRVVAAPGRGGKGPESLGRVLDPLWASDPSRGTGSRCSNGIPQGALRGRVSGPGTVNPGTSRLPLRPHLTTLGSRDFQRDPHRRSGKCSH